MIRQCAWCCRVLGLIPPLEDQSVTHGVCPECNRKLLEAQEAAPLQIKHQDSAIAAILSVEVTQ
jgi:hypothetical protein